MIFDEMIGDNKGRKMNEDTITKILSFEDFISKCKYKRSDEVVAYELYLVIKKLEELTE